MTFPIDLKPTDGSELLRLRSTQEVLEFIARERAVYDRLIEAANASPRFTPALNNAIEVLDRRSRFLNDIQNTISDARVDASVQLLQQMLAEERQTPLVTSPRFAPVLLAAKAISWRGALGAFCAINSMWFCAEDPDQVRGVTLAHAAMDGTGPVARRSVQEALSNLLRRLRDQQLRVEDRADDLDGRIERLDDRRKAQLRRIIVAGNKAADSYAKRLEGELDDFKSRAQISIDEINHVKDVYTEHMALQGPVTYWHKKAAEHKNLARLVAGLGLLYAGALIWYAYAKGFWDLLRLVKDAVNETHQVQIAYVILSMGVFLLTVAFWIGRLISRTYVSQSHLAIDAAERATMVQTYLALAERNQVAIEDRQLVLASLFRPSADGLVKDDAAPDTSIPGILARFGAGAGRPV